MKIFPVIRATHPTLSAEHARKALELGADGVYLIDPQSSNDNKRLFTVLNNVRRQAGAEDFIGLAMHHMPGSAALYAVDRAVQSQKLGTVPNGIWVQDAKAERKLGEARGLQRTVPRLRSVQFAAGIAFAGTVNYDSGPQKAAMDAEIHKRNIDVAVTTGDEKGRPPSIEKITAMRARAGYIAVTGAIPAARLSEYQYALDEYWPSEQVTDEGYLTEIITIAHELPELPDRRDWPVVRP